MERGFAYKYLNGRQSVTGHGWLGFERRTVIETVYPGVGLPPAELSGSGRSNHDHGSSTRRRATRRTARTAAGTTHSRRTSTRSPVCARSITIDESASVNGVTPPLESAPHRRRTRVSERLGVSRYSTAGRPFPAVRQRLTISYERPVPSFPAPSPDLETAHV